MGTTAENLEPAPRDPAKLRRTAWILVAVAVVGGFLILKAYNRSAAKLAEDERPAFANARLLQKFKVARQDRSEHDLLNAEGVVVLAPVCFEQAESWTTTRGVMTRLVDRFAGNPAVKLVCMTVDPDHETAAKLAGYADELGAELPQWWVAGAEAESTHKLLKSRLKADTMPHRDEDGRWIYDPALIVLDREGRKREATVRARKPDGQLLNHRNPVAFDFEQAASWDAEGRREGLAKSNVETLEELFFETIDYLVSHPES